MKEVRDLIVAGGVAPPHSAAIYGYRTNDMTDKGAQQLVVSAGQGCQAALKASEYVKRVKSGENQ
jgi:hypothetical protein